MNRYEIVESHRDGRVVHLSVSTRVRFWALLLTRLGNRITASIPDWPWRYEVRQVGTAKPGNARG